MSPIPALDVSRWAATDASAWTVVGEEKRGLREKLWVQSPDGSLWLRKTPRHGRPYEPAIELIGLEAGRLAGLDSARAVLATWRDDEGRDVRGICVLRFLSDGDHLVAGNELMRGADRGYDAERRQDHTLSRARGALRWLEDREGIDLVRPFMDLLFFDAWIGNGDRHPGNWSIMRTVDRGTVFAPMYDPASSLGAVLTDDKLLLRPPGQAASHGERRDYELAFHRFVQKCPSGFGDSRGLIGMVQLVREAAGTREWQERGGKHLAVIASILPGIQGFVDQLQETWMPRPRKLLAKRLLEQRLRWLREML